MGDSRKSIRRKLVLVLDDLRVVLFYGPRLIQTKAEAPMKDKKIFKKWWFWVTVVVILGAIGSLGQSGDRANNTTKPNNSQQTKADSQSTLPELNADDYRSKEGLVVYKELKSKGYKVEAAFEKQALTDINGKASEVFEPLDPNKAEDRQSVDAFIVGDLVQSGDSVSLSIVQKNR